MRAISLRFIVGLTLLSMGVALVLDLLFSIHLPLFQLALAFLLIAIGLRVIVRRRLRETRGPESGEAWLADRHFAPEGKLEQDASFDIVFGRGVIDLTHLEPPTTDVTITVDAVFGSAVVKLDPEIAYDVKATSSFGEVRLPHGRAAATPPPHLHLEINAVFGACEVVEAIS